MGDKIIRIVEINERRWYQKDGVYYPSTSSVLDILFPVAKNFIPEDALVRGTICHAETAKALLARIEGTEYEPPPDKMVAARVSAALKYVDRLGGDVVAIESYNIFMNVGLTSDCIVDKNGFKTVIDWKFAESISERYYYQCEFYQRAEGADTALIVQITREGNVRPVLVGKDERRWDLIKSAINVRQHLDMKEKRYVEQ